MQEKILVTGANGFIGSEICRLGVLMGHKVVGVARKGRGSLKEGWADKVEWVKADVLKPEDWAVNLQGCKAVIHCVSIIRESGKDSTYQRVNIGTAEVVAREAEKAGVAKVIYLSVNSQVSILPAFYESKRKAEEALKGHSYQLAILRSGLVYGERRAPTILAGNALKAFGSLPLIGKTMRQNSPLSVWQVATAALVSAFDDGVEGILNVETIEKLAQRKLRNFAAK
jgi:nucleoside-diphosphate-sugar epimerase